MRLAVSFALPDEPQAAYQLHGLYTTCKSISNMRKEERKINGSGSNALLMTRYIA